MTSPSTTTCPHCGREVEQGFRFCDNCGKPLATREEVMRAPQMRPEKVEFSRADTEQEASAPPDEPAPEEAASLLARLRQLRRDRPESEEKIAFTPVEVFEPEPTKAEPEAKESPTWRPVPRADKKRFEFSLRVVLVWIAHLLIALICGVLLVAATGAVASLVSDGRTALLEIRGLPIFIAGATSVIVFTFLRTGRVRETTTRRTLALAVTLGFLVLVVVSAIVYRPSPMHAAQMRLDRTLRVYGPAEKEAVEGFQSEIGDWNSELDHYRTDLLAPVLGARRNVRQFRFDASASEETMKSIVDRMRTHADSANNARIRDALNGLASIYDDERSGISLITRGVINDDQALVSQGDTRFKQAQKRTSIYVRLRVTPLLDRAGLDADSFETAIAT